MHPQFRIDTLHEHSQELARQSERARLLGPGPTRARIADEAVSFRLARVSDEPSLERLAALEGREVPRGGQLVAEVNGEVVAAMPLAGGDTLADPFRPTAHLLPLMRMHAAQLYTPSRPRRALHVFHHRPAHARATIR
jgi:hypothetical protein